MITKIIKFGSKTCMPCKMLDKTLEKIQDVEIVKYDIEEEQDLAIEMGVRNVPVMFFYDKEEMKEKTVGAIPLDKINEVLEKYK